MILTDSILPSRAAQCNTVFPYLLCVFKALKSCDSGSNEIRYLIDSGLIEQAAQCNKSFDNTACVRSDYGNKSMIVLNGVTEWNIA